MSKKILIAYGSRYGSTEEIAHSMAEMLQNAGLETQLIDLRRIKQKDWPPLASFDGVLVGSGIKIGRWTKDATAFLKTLVSELKGLKPKGLVVGVFVSCGMASTPGQQKGRSYTNNTSLPYCSQITGNGYGLLGSISASIFHSSAATLSQVSMMPTQIV